MLNGGLLFNDAGIKIIESMNRDFVKGLFCPRKLSYASDRSPAGLFRSATVAGLTEFFGEEHCSEGVTKT